jgi:DNA repair ATPase RecN
MGEERGGAAMLTKEDILAIAGLMDEKLKPINDRLDGMDSRLDGMDSRLDKMDHRLAEVETRLGKVGEVASGAKILLENEVDRAIKVLGDGHKGLLGEIKALVTPDQLEEVSVRVFALEEGFKKHSRQIEELQQKTG